ncbi:MAG: MtrB/PioB family outer membrane beta-barrel protein, partial [Xanthomonadales bacterium]|nr:MtrB/PioB family outer membrane beta-barrel protein [Xanthomonadales bacterium]
MNANRICFFNFLAAILLSLPLAISAQEEDPFALEGVDAETEEQPEVPDEVTVGLYYLDDDSYRFGKYTGLTDEGAEPLVDFRIDRRPQWDSGDTVRWSLEGWRLGLDSRRLLLDMNQQGTQSFVADYREIPNNRFSDGQTPYRGAGQSVLTLPASWAVEDGSNNTRGFLTLDENLANLKIDTLRRRMDLGYERKLPRGWSLSVDYRHETKRGERPIGSIFGFTGGNPRAVLVPAPVDYTTDNVDAMFSWSHGRAQFGFGVFASWFSNDETSLVWQNAYGRQPQWDESVQYPGSQG